jgi:DNA polymerase III subunit epsilon
MTAPVPWYLGPLVGFDLETTGPYPDTAIPVQIGMMLIEGGEVTERIEYLVNPGIPIPAQATAIHGLTDEMVAGGLELGEAMIRCREGLDHCQAPIVGCNIAYDLTVIDRLSNDEFDPHPVLDLLVLDKHFDKYRKGSRTLTNVAAVYGVPEWKAHGAADDAIGSVLAVIELAKRYPAVGNSTPEKLHALQIRSRMAWASEFKEYLRRTGGDFESFDVVAEGAWPIRPPRDASLPAPLPTMKERLAAAEDALGVMMGWAHTIGMFAVDLERWQAIAEAMGVPMCTVVDCADHVDWKTGD